MKIKKVLPNNHKKAFEVVVNGRPSLFPYSRLRVRPDADNRVVKAFVDPELGKESFTYTLAQGQEDSIWAVIHNPRLLKQWIPPKKI